MTNKPKAIGTDWENRVRDFLKAVWPLIQRLAQCGSNDKGDFTGTGDWCIEAKASLADMSSGLNEAEVERKNAGARFCAVVVKRKSHRTENAYVALTFQMFREVLLYIKELEEKVAWLEAEQRRGTAAPLPMSPLPTAPSRSRRTSIRRTVRRTQSGPRTPTR